MRNVSIFDFDGTLIRKDSFTGFIRYALGLQRAAKVIWRSLQSVTDWRLGKIPAEQAKRELFRNAFTGYPCAEFVSKGAAYADVIDSITRTEMMTAMRVAVQRGDMVIIVSASLDSWIRPWAERHGVYNVIATEADLRGNIMTGEFITPNCSGQEKVRRLLERFPEINAHRDDYNIVAYGDSEGDNALLAFANLAVRVQPEPFEFLTKWL